MDYICPAAAAATGLQPPGLMKMRFNIIRSIMKGIKHFRTPFDVVCHPHNVSLPHEQLQGVRGAKSHSEFDPRPLSLNPYLNP